MFEFYKQGPLVKHSRKKSVFTAYGILFNTSNGVGAANFNATGQSDSTYSVSDTVGFANCQMNRRYATGVTDPLVMIDVATETLRAYAAPPGLNMGAEQTLGRRLFGRGTATAPCIDTFAISGSTSLNWRGDSTSPQSGGNACARAIAYANARKIAMGRSYDFGVMFIGENDTGSSGAANAVAANIASFTSTFRAGIGQPTLPMFIVYNIATTGAFSSTVYSQIDTAVAADPYMRRVYVDDIALASNPHYGANGYYDVGDRIEKAVTDYRFPGQAFNLEAPSNFPRLQDWGAAITIPASGSGSPRSGPDLQDGDAQILVVSSYATDSVYSLSTPAGFTTFGSGKFQSIFSGTVFRSMQIYWRLVDEATLAANNRQMPNPTVTCGTVATSETYILTFRGPNKWTSNPFDLFVTGVNNANNTALVIGGGTTAVANELAILLCTIPGNTGSVTSCTNAALQNLTKRREALVSQSAVIGMGVHTGQIPTQGTVVGNTTYVMNGVGVNAGAFITLKP